jgi:O-antigen/teichoic acid export membrane protein
MSVKRNVIANYLASGCAALAMLAFIPVYVRFLGVESYGLIGFFATLQAWTLLLDLGLSPTLNREMARYSAGVISRPVIRDLLGSAETWSLCLALAAAGLVAALAYPLAHYWFQAHSLSTDTIVRAVVAMGAAIGCQWMASFFRSAILGLQDQVWLSVEAAVVATLRTAGAALVLAFVASTLEAYFAYQCVVGAAESLLLGWHLHRRLGLVPTVPTFTLHALRPVFRFAGGMAALMFLATMLTQIDKLLLVRLLPLGQFGYFSLAATVAGGLAVLIVPIYNVAYPRLSELAAIKDQSGLADQYHRFAQLLSIGVLPPATVLCVFSADVVFVWTGDAAMGRAVAPLLSVWVLGTALNGLMHVPFAAQLAHGWTRLSTILNAIAVAATVPCVLIFVPVYGAVAAGWIWTAINAGYVLFGVTAMHRRILVAEKWTWYGWDVLAPLLACGAMVVPIFFFHASQPAPSRVADAAFLLGGTAALLAAAWLATPLGRQLVQRSGRQLLRR